ncbi:MAG TPA: RES family NAD+ phosphorylase [Longimicrobium sp.]|jgi:hypothetical protein|uniref:RES family NAD+ phosphorylase n=1 Tax=Longimicrobium sp. TaxID=2029185 RepID=UPI002ED9CA70
MADRTKRLWRVFPWDPAARAGAPFSVQSFAPRHAQGGGRFDLRDLTSVLYLATSAAHAYAEVLRGFPNTRLTDDHLVHASGHRLASVTVDIPLALYDGLPDLAVGEVLDRYGVRADTLALPPTRRAQTQAVARLVWDDGQAGFRWWSAFHGEWHSTVLFMERVKLDATVFGPPRPASLSDPDVLTGAREAGMID